MSRFASTPVPTSHFSSSQNTSRRRPSLHLRDGQRSTGEEIIGAGDFDAQAEQTFSNLRRVPSWRLVARADRRRSRSPSPTWATSKIVDLRGKWTTPPYPADTIVEVTSLAARELEIEIEAIAVMGLNARCDFARAAQPSRTVGRCVGSGADRRRGTAPSLGTWTETWELGATGTARLAAVPVEEQIDEAGNQWFTLRGALRIAPLPDRRPPRLGPQRVARRLPQRAGRRRGCARHGRRRVRRRSRCDSSIGPTRKARGSGRSLFGSGAEPRCDQDEVRKLDRPRRRRARGRARRARHRPRPRARRRSELEERRRLPRAAHRAGPGAGVA